MIKKLILTICFVFISKANAIEADKIAGSLEAEHNGQLIYFPALSTDIEADIQGDIANVTVTQKFKNPTKHALNANYLFPLNKDAAVYAMQMQVGDEVIKAKIKKKQEAKKTFEQAKSQGKAASLLTQHRPNMYTQKIANLMPGLPVTVKISYTQIIPKIDDEYELVLPLIVGPRYQPAQPATEQTTTTNNGWQVQTLPQYPDVKGLDIPDEIDNERVSIRVNLNSALPISNIYSDTHQLSIIGDDKYKSLTLASGKTIDNADFVLRYGLAGKSNTAGMLTSKDERGGFFSLMIEPPVKPNNAQITPREMVFVLDTSGSMSGTPMNASKAFMNHAMKTLRPTDYFRIIRFSNNASEYSSQPVLATAKNIKDGLEYIQSLNAGGGTEIPNAINQAFSTTAKQGTMRIVVFLTDGYIGNENQVLKLISQKIGKARIYALGVGTSVNRYLLAEMGRMGCGFARFIDPTENSNDAAIKFANSLKAPVLTDINIDWGNMQVSDVTPSIIPDLFAGDSIRIQGKFDGLGKHKITVNGKVNGAKASLPINVDLAQSNSNDKAIPLIWARTKVADYMREYNTSPSYRSSEYSDSQLKELVTKLGLEFAISTKWTSFVAVSKKIVNKTSKAKDARVPLPMVKGVNKNAYGKHYQQTQFAGHSAPEPATIGGLLVLGAAGMAAKRRKKHAVK